MATFIPFKGTRFNVPNDLLSWYVCPPYDIISNEKRKEILDGNPNNIVSVELPIGDDNRYKAAGSKLKELLSDYLLVKDEEEGYYVYEMAFEVNGEKRKLEGIIGRMKLEPFEKGIIIPHENTLSAAKEDRFNLMKETHANISPIYSLFDDSKGKIQEIIDEVTSLSPMSFVEYEEVTHSLYQVKSNNISLIKKYFEDKKVFIADGHHRYETALRFKEYLKESGENIDDNNPASYIMMACFSMQHPGLEVLPTHRTINTRDNFSSEKLLKDCSSEFNISKLSKEEAILGLENNDNSYIYYDGEYYLFTLKKDVPLEGIMPGMSKAYMGLDVAVLHSCILTPYLGISKEDLLKGSSLIYTRDFSEAIERVDKGFSSCSFILKSTPVSSVAAVALEGEKMPQKSTYFYPKLLTGLVVNIM